MRYSRLAGFIGAPTNLLSARFESKNMLRLGELRRSTCQKRNSLGGEITFGIRPEDVDIASGELPPGWVDLPATVEVVDSLGSDTLVFTNVFGASMTARVRPGRRPIPGSQIKLRINPDHAHLFDAETGRAILNAVHWESD